MIILAVDDERLQLSRLTRSIDEACPDAELISFMNPREAATWIENNRPDVSFLDIEMPEIKGTMLAKMIKTRYPDSNIIFATAYDEYAHDAFKLHASGYLRKPVSAELVKLELEDLRYPMDSGSATKDIQIRCFGGFDVFCQGNPLKFQRNKTAELFAYLVDRRGAAVSVNEICAVLWEDSDDDEKNKSYLRHLVSDLAHTLEEAGQEGVFIKQKNNYAVDTKLVQCDYYDYLDGKPYAIKAFYGEYMSKYSWAEETLAMLLNR